jgi:hypothetical protein
MSVLHIPSDGVPHPVVRTELTSQVKVSEILKRILAQWAVRAEKEADGRFFVGR